MKLYGKNERSNSKLRAVDAFNNGKDFDAIARELRVQRSTAEVYTIDAFAAGKHVDHERMANLMDVTTELFAPIWESLQQKDRLSEVKESVRGITYNQIRFVLACVIRDVEI